MKLQLIYGYDVPVEPWFNQSDHWIVFIPMCGNVIYRSVGETHTPSDQPM